MQTSYKGPVFCEEGSLWDLLACPGKEVQVYFLCCCTYKTLGLPPCIEIETSHTSGSSDSWRREDSGWEGCLLPEAKIMSFACMYEMSAAHKWFSFFKKLLALYLSEWGGGHVGFKGQLEEISSLSSTMRSWRLLNYDVLPVSKHLYPLKHLTGPIVLTFLRRLLASWGFLLLRKDLMATLSCVDLSNWQNVTVEDLQIQTFHTVSHRHLELHFRGSDAKLMTL